MMIIPQSPAQSAPTSFNCNTPKVDTAVIQPPKHPIIRAFERGDQPLRTRIENKIEEYTAKKNTSFCVSGAWFIGGTVALFAGIAMIGLPSLPLSMKYCFLSVKYCIWGRL